MKKVSIIIVTYNSEKDIYDCISSIQKFSDIPLSEIELIIVDNNSRNTDTMFDKLKEMYGDGIVLIKNTHNGGYGQGNNVGIRKASAPIILIMNPDVRLFEPIFKTAVEAFESDTKLAMYGMKQMLTPTQPSTNSFTCAYTVNGYIQTVMSSMGNRFDHYISKYMHFSGSCFYIRKQMFEQVGLFDESVFMYGEEEDIHYRMWQHGFKTMVYNPRLHYIHMVKDRKPELKYELKLIDVAILQAQKKGFSAKKMLTNRLKNANILIFRERIKMLMGKNDKSQINMLLELKAEINNKIKMCDIKLNRKTI